MHEAGCGEADVGLVGRLHDQAQVFLHQVDHEARRVVALDHFRAEVRKLPGIGGPGGNGGDGLLDIEPVLSRERQRLADAHVRDRDENLVDEFRELARAAGAAVDDCLAHEREEGFDLFERGRARRRP